MYKGKKILGVITARSGSKGIPNKNIKELMGKPLIAYTIEAALKSKCLTRTITSTDSESYRQIAIRYGGDAPFLRPEEISTDKSKSIDVLRHALSWLKETEGQVYDYCLILQPTSPLRSSLDIDNSIKLAVDSKADSVMSMVELSNFAPHKIKKIDRSFRIAPYFKGENEGKAPSQRQKLASAYRRNCAIYLTKVEHVMRGDLFGKISLALVMPEERSIDINTPFDFELAEFFMRRMRS